MSFFKDNLPKIYLKSLKYKAAKYITVRVPNIFFFQDKI